MHFNRVDAASAADGADPTLVLDSLQTHCELKGKLTK